jgi:hypothetical protein
MKMDINSLGKDLDALAAGTGARRAEEDAMMKAVLV